MGRDPAGVRTTHEEENHSKLRTVGNSQRYLTTKMFHKGFMSEIFECFAKMTSKICNTDRAHRHLIFRLGRPHRHCFQLI